MLFLQLSRAHEPTRDPGSPTRDPAMNSVTVSATFDVGRFLADNVGVVPTRADMSPTFPTKRQPHEKLTTKAMWVWSGIGILLAEYTFIFKA